MTRVSEQEDRKSSVNANQLITIGDLEKFKGDLLAEIRQIIKPAQQLSLKKWMKSNEVRKLLNVSPGKLQTMRKSGVLSYRRIGGIIYYDQEDINQMFEKSKVN